MANEKVFSFKNELNKGKTGETLFKKCYPEALQTAGRKEDFFLNGESVEVKTDFWNPVEYPNFFIEMYSNDNKMTFGGPFRAEQDKIKYFVYLFIQTGEFHWFRVTDIMPFLYENIALYPRKLVKNRGYNGIGYLVPIKDLAKFRLKVDKFDV